MPGFVLFYRTDETETIHRYKDDKLQAGSFRFILSNGDSCFGTRIFSKSLKAGEEDKKYSLYKNADGNIHYFEEILVIGQDKEWRNLTIHKFNPQELDWEELRKPDAYQNLKKGTFNLLKIKYCSFFLQ